MNFPEIISMIERRKIMPIFQGQRARRFSMLNCKIKQPMYWQPFYQTGSVMKCFYTTVSAKPGSFGCGFAR